MRHVSCGIRMSAMIHIQPGIQCFKYNRFLFPRSDISNRSSAAGSGHRVKINVMMM